MKQFALLNLVSLQGRNMNIVVIAIAATFLANFVSCKDACNVNFQMFGCYQERITGKLLINNESEIDWNNLASYLQELACVCGTEAQKQGYSGFSMHYNGQCYGKTQRDIEDLVKKDLQQTKCYGEQRYVDCLKEEHTYCLGKEEAEAVYQFTSVVTPSVDGGFGQWQNWTECDKACGDGFMYRERNCDNPRPEGDGKDCSRLGPFTERKPCKIKDCPVDGGWSMYGAYGPCTKPCDGGVQYRHRTCTNPAPAHGGKCCLGQTTEAKACNIHGCPVNGGWGPFGNYSSCSKRCGGGIQKRQRLCNNPLPLNGGATCQGPEVERRPCNTGLCPDIANCSIKYTNLESHGGGNMVYLDRHALLCNQPGGVLSMFHLQRHADRIRYEYQCCKIALRNTCRPEHRASVFSDDGGGQAIYLDRHEVNCGSTGFVTDFRLERNPSQGHIRYNYNCCMLTNKWSSFAKCYEGHTRFTFDGNGRIYYLDRQTVKCNAGYGLSYFLLQRQNGQYRYHYRCCKILS